MKSLLKAQSLKIADISQKITKIAIYSLIFLTPLFFLPWTLDTLDFNKQILLIILVSVAFLAWLVKILISPGLLLNLNFLNAPVLVFFLIYGLSTIFSQWRYSSFWGLPFNISQGFLSLFYFLIFYFLLSNVFTEEKEIFLLFFLFLSSGAVAALYATLQIFGKFSLPWDFTRVSSFNTIGGLGSLSIFIALLLPLATCLIFLVKRKTKFLLSVFILFFLALLILINFRIALIASILGLFIIFIFAIFNFRKTGKSYLIWLPMFLLIFILFFLVFPVSLVQSPTKVLPSQRMTFNIAKGVLTKNPFFGIGPANFIFGYSRFKPIDINQTAFWNIRFRGGASEFFDKLITTGILGILALLFLFGIFLWSGLKYLKEKVTSKKRDKNWLLFLAIFSIFFSLIFAQFLYPANFSLVFSFWFLSGIFAAFFSKTKIRNPKIPSLVLITFLVLISLLVIGLSFASLRNYIAEARYFRGLKAWEDGQIEEAIYYLKGAINLNSGLDRYWRDLSKIYLAKLNKQGLSSEEIGGLINDILSYSRKAAEISPKNVANWDLRGSVYENLIGLAGGAGDLALKNFKKASELDPQNPYFPTEIGKVYLKKADIFSKKAEPEKVAENLTQAQDNFQKSLALKSDYAPAHFQIAMVYLRQGKTKEAIEKLESTKSIAPFDVGLAFQLGLLYYNNNQLNKAKSEFERAISIDENYSNARYFLGLIYDQQGDKEKAIEQFEKIEKLNPGNFQVKKILSNLRKGLPALEGIQPAEEPIEKKPLEKKP